VGHAPVWNFLGAVVIHSYNYPHSSVPTAEGHLHSDVPRRLSHVVPEERFVAFLPLLHQALSLTPLSLRQWQVLLGHLTASQYATRRGRLHLRPVQRFLLPLIHQGIPWVRRFLDVHLVPHLEWWCEKSNVLEGVPLRDFKAEVEIFTDASKQGWGARTRTRKPGRWTPLPLGRI